MWTKHRTVVLLLLAASLSLLVSQSACATDLDLAKSQILEISGRCKNELVCVNKAWDLSQAEIESRRILEDTMIEKAKLRHGNINGLCFGIVIENQMNGLGSLAGSRDKMRIAAYITYNLYENLQLAIPKTGTNCRKDRIVIFYSRRDSTLYTFATEGTMQSADIRLASSAARPYFSVGIFEGMRFLVLAYADTISKGGKK